MYEKAQALQDEMVRLRRDFHAHPELSFQEFRTAKVVADTLAEIGVTNVKTEVGRTGVVAEIGTGDGPTIGIRGDMDALPIFEEVDVEFKSTNDGVMHACGHDSHTAMLLGVAHLLHESFVTEPDKWHGNVRLLFQPSEEAFDADGVSGATAMIQDGALEGVDKVIALHIISNMDAGKVYFHDGPSLAAVDSFECYIRGDGGHGAYPHEGSDPLYILSTILPRVYGIPSRRINPLEPCIISIGEIRGGSAPNVIPAEIYLQGTIRSMSPETRARLAEELESAFKLADNLGGSAEFILHSGYPALVNDAEVNDWMRTVATEMIGEENVVDAPGGMGAEDFSYMALEAPGSMFNLGGYLSGTGHHTPQFDISEEVFPIGAAIMAETARRFVTGELE